MDKLEFRIVKAEELQEEWVLDYSSEEIANIRQVEIFVNGQDLKDIITTIEKPYMIESGCPPEDADYGHNTVDYMQHQFAKFSDKKSFISTYGIELFCCLDCGDPGCWSVVCKFRQEGDVVFMEDFRHNHRDWKYNLCFCFSKENFEAEILKLQTQQ